MKKENAKTVEEKLMEVGEQEAPVPTITPTQEYFTEELEASMREMSESEMLKELLILEETRAWIAILKYNQIRLVQSQGAIFAGDPIKDPTNMLRNQGVMLGLSDMQNAIIILKKERADKAAGKEE